MKVQVTAQSSEYDLPLIAFLKLYDHRYLEDRMQDDSKDSWNPQVEEQVTYVVQKLKACLDAKRSSGVNGIQGDGRDYDEDDYDEEADLMDESDACAVELWRRDCFYRDSTKSWFDTECKAYNTLRPLQGLCVPTFYGSTLFDERAEYSQDIHTDVSGILLEFINGINLEDFDVTSPLALTRPQIGQATVNCYKRIISLGVLHGDVRLPNIIVRNDGRVFLLDFALAMIREKQSDDDWNEQINSEGEMRLIKMLLDKKALRDRTPPEPYWNTREGYGAFNAFLLKARKCWRRKYYDEVMGGTASEYRLDGNGNRYLHKRAEWQLKSGAAERRRSFLDQNANCW